MRSNNRKKDELRDISMEVGYNPYAEGSCLIKVGSTHVLCTASVENTVPRFLRGSGKGWITSEYGMLPRSTATRMNRKSILEGGRTQEIQRLIGRSLRAVVDLEVMGEMQIKVDCDVIQADGGTRTASITGAYVALKCAEKKLLSEGKISNNFIIHKLSAISCGICNGDALLDLDYVEDSSAQTDANFILTENGVVEVQATAEDKPFCRKSFNSMFDLAEKGCKELFLLQQQALEG